MAATNASKQAKSNAGSTSGSAPVVAHTYQNESLGTDLTFTFANRGEYMETLGAIAIAMGLSAQQRDFERMTTLLGSATRLWYIGRGGGDIAATVGESPPLARTASAAPG